VHVPVAAFTVTVAWALVPPSVTEPMLHTELGVAVIVGTLAAVPVSFELAVTMNVEFLAALPGAPVKLTTGVTFVAEVICVAEAALYALLAAHAAFRSHVPLPLSIVTVAVVVMPIVASLLTEHGVVVAEITAVLV
jgi:hypothetical protein